jgi:glycosyltransferase involved in cell wall biosynthesis
MADHPRIAVCICTCRRPDGLRRALDGIARQDFAGQLRVVVIENHSAQEGAALCAELAPTYPFELEWKFEPAPGIPMAQNAALEMALSRPVDFVAMIDDDEWPSVEWLRRLLTTQSESDADIVCGPIEPVFEQDPPSWAKPCGFFRRTGENYATSNILLRAEMLRKRSGNWFDSRLAFTGDGDNRMISYFVQRGYRYAVNFDATVYESVPKSRANLRYMVLRGVRDGNTDMFAPDLLDRRHTLQFARLAKFFRKLLYACNHLLWSPFRPWRIVQALVDLGSCTGMIFGMLDYRYLFYGSRQGARTRLVRVRRSDWQTDPSRMAKSSKSSGGSQRTC